MADFHTLVAAVAEAGGLHWPDRAGRPLDAVCSAFAADLPVDGVSMSVFAGGTARETVGSSGALADTIEDEQYALGIGPCYDAFARGGPVLVADVRDAGETRWPAFSRSLARTPVRALFAFPLHLGGVVVGAVDAYRVRPGLPDGADLRDLLRAVDLLVLALASARGPGPSAVVAASVVSSPVDESGLGDGGSVSSPGDRPVDGDDRAARSGPPADPGWDDFLDALPSDRARVHQAIGMVIGQLGGTPEQSLARIRAYAFSHERAITDVAADIVARRLQLPA